MEGVHTIINLKIFRLSFCMSFLQSFEIHAIQWPISPVMMNNVVVSFLLIKKEIRNIFLLVIICCNYRKWLSQMS